MAYLIDDPHIAATLLYDSEIHGRRAENQISEKSIPDLEALPTPSCQVRKHPPGQEYTPDQRSCSNTVHYFFFVLAHWAAEEATRLACFLSSQRCWKYTVRTRAISTAMVVWLLHASEQTAPSLPMMLTLRVASLMTRLRIRSDGSRER